MNTVRYLGLGIADSLTDNYREENLRFLSNPGFILCCTRILDVNLDERTYSTEYAGPLWGSFRMPQGQEFYIMPTHPGFLGYEKVPNAVPTLPKIIYNPSFSISSFPNPTNAFATIYSNSPKAGTISITDLLGKKLYSEQIQPGEAKISLDLRDLPPGNYFATLEAEGKAKASAKITLAK